MENENVINLGSGKTNNEKIDKTLKALDNPDITPAMAAQIINNDEFGPQFDVVNLPSKGIFYASKQSFVKVKLLTSDDENILTSSDLIRSGKVLDILLDNAIVDGELTSDIMLVGDRNAVLLYLRKEGYGDEYEVKMTCPKCIQEFTDIVLISDLKYKEPDTKPEDDGQYSIELPKTKWKIRFKLLTGADEAIINKKGAVQRKKKHNISYDKTLTERYLKCVTSINGITDILQIDKAVTNMPIKDSLFLREYIRVVEPGVDMEHQFTCKNCGEHFEDAVPINAKLFWPNAKI